MYKMISHTIHELHETSTVPEFSLKVQPPVTANRRWKTDLSLMTVSNSRTRVIVEVKRKIAERVSIEDGDYYAQLFYETRLLHQTEEGRDRQYLIVLTDTVSFHCFVVEFKLSMDIKAYA